MAELTLLHVVGGEYIGYGRMGANIASELRKQKVTVYDSLADSPMTRGEAAHALEFDGERTAGLTNVVAWASVPTHARGWWEGQVPVILTMWEASVLPESFRENLHEFDTVIVPSEQNLKLFSEFHPNVKYVPLGVDPQRWSFVERRAPLTRFNFLIGGSGQRKGTDLAVKAFKAAFPDGSWGYGPTPYLVMKQPKPQDFYGDRIERVTGRLSAQAEVDLYSSAHCYLQPSRGEGFGLQPLQAIAQGIPTILTNAHGHESFAHLGMGLSTTMVEAGYFIYGMAGEWWEPDLDELIGSMRWVYDNYAEAAAKAEVNAGRVVTEGFTWANVAKNFLEAIGPERCGPYTGSKEWRAPVAKLYRVVTIKDWMGDVGGNRYVLTKGEDYWLPADVKRILYESGRLDAAACCLGEDTGLLPDQLQRIPGLLDRQNYCPTCYQKFGSGRTIADEIMAGERE